jgi:hypothetical protein
MKLALIDTTNTVINVIISDFDVVENNIYSVRLEDDEVCEIGCIYNQNEIPRFTRQPQTYTQKWTSYEFLLRFTAEERSAFRAASLTDSMVADFQQLAQAAQEIINTDPMTVAGMNYLVSVGLLTEQRKTEILGV